MVDVLKVRMVLGILVVAIPACTQQPSKDNLSNAPEKCKAHIFQKMLWKPSSALNDVSLPKETRVILPDQAVTMDYRPARLNITIGKLGRIEKVYCG